MAFIHCFHISATNTIHLSQMEFLIAELYGINRNSYYTSTVCCLLECQEIYPKKFKRILTFSSKIFIGTNFFRICIFRKHNICTFLAFWLYSTRILKMLILLTLYVQILLWNTIFDTLRLIYETQKIYI